MSKNNLVMDLSNMIFDIKEKITDEEYKNLMNKLMILNNCNTNIEITKNGDDNNLNPNNIKENILGALYSSGWSNCLDEE